MPGKTSIIPKIARTLLAAVLGVICGTSHAQNGLYLTGTVEGWHSRATAISYDGSIAAGYSESLTTQRNGFLWSRPGDRIDIPGGSLENYSMFVDISGDGSTTVGTTIFAGQPGSQPMRWRAGSGFEQIPRPSNLSVSFAGRAIATNHNGGVVAGTFTRELSQGNLKRAFRWSESTGSVDLGSIEGPGGYNEAFDVSADGNSIVGSSQPGGLFDTVNPFLWTATGGMSALEFPADSIGLNLYGVARGISANGRVVVGEAAGRDRNYGVKWVDGTVERIVAPVGWRTSGATDLSHDGSVILGSMETLDQTIGVDFIWTAAWGVLSSREYFERHGFTYSQTGDLDLYSVSGDGLTFCGRYYDPAIGGSEVGAVVVLPAPAGLGLILMAAAFRNRRQSSSSQPIGGGEQPSEHRSTMDAFSTKQKKGQAANPIALR